MTVDREKFMAFPEEIKKCLLDCKVENVEFKVDFSDGLLEKPISEFLPVIVSELTDNCMEKGAKSIYVTLSDNFLRVEDDFVEPDPEKTLKLINKIKESGKIITTKDSGGGIGITRIVMGFLNRFGGDLNYYVNDGKIVAEATWE